MNMCNFSKQSQHINQLHVTKCQVAHGFYIGKVTNSQISWIYMTVVFLASANS